jgi:hypothetical protein
MSSQTQIANRALQILGDDPIVNLTDNNARAKAINRAYDPVRQAELRKHRWHFAKKRKALAPDSTAPAFGPAYQYTLPADCLYVLRDDDCDDRDWSVEGRKILTDTDTSINLKYVADITDTTLFDALFAEMLAAALAEATCEKITGSSSKLADARDAYQEARAEARRINAFEAPAQTFAKDDWLIAAGWC